MTLQVFVEELLRKHLGLVEPTIMIQSDIVYEAGDDLDEDEVEHYATQAAKPLTVCFAMCFRVRAALLCAIFCSLRHRALRSSLQELRMSGGQVVRIEDNAQVLEIDLIIVHWCVNFRCSLFL
jgi:Ubiquitin/SUMO-activating enzyme ubiquitin-like domain